MWIILISNYFFKGILPRFQFILRQNVSKKYAPLQNCIFKWHFLTESCQAKVLVAFRHHFISAEIMPEVCSVFSISLRCHHGIEVKISKIYLSGVFVHLLHVIFAVFFVIKLLVFVLAYIMFNIALIFKGQKTLFRSFLVRLRENLEFYLLLISLFFLDGKYRQINFG